MQLHIISNKLKKSKSKRVGRGGKRGTYSGRGQKGQRARSGHRIRPAERDLIQRLPKLRGVKNKPKSLRSFILNLKNLDRFIEDGKLSKTILVKNGVIKKISQSVKILGVGEITNPIMIEEIYVSEKAKKKIEKAGGSVQ